MTGALGAGLFVAALSLWVAVRARAKALAQLRTAWGTPIDRERNMEAIGDRFDRSAPVLDDRTWRDLLLDDVFAQVDRAVSTIGQQALYLRLRCAPAASHRDEFERLVDRFQRDAAARERIQAALSALSDPAGYYVHRLCRPGAIQRRGWHVVFPVIALSMAAILVCSVRWPILLVVAVAAVAVNLAVRVATARRVGSAIASFRQLGPVFTAAARIERTVGRLVPAIAGTLEGDLHALARLRLLTGWVSRDPLRSGDLFMSLMEYLNLLFLLDANALYFASSDLERHGTALLRVIDAVGEVDAAIAIASWRCDLAPDGWTRPVFVTGGMPVRLDDLRHPLVADAVPNSISLAPPHGLLVTGSNMSGKSTFLRTLGVNVILAQTINTCLAARYEAPLFTVRSCIGVSDDLLAGKSYYLVEVETVLAMVAASSRPEPQLLLFDELFRGTNAVERIAVAESVLLALVADGRPHVVLAATHDGELVELLRGRYDVCHFGDALGPDGLTFDYRLTKGPATSRNAIALLRQGGAPAAVVDHAVARAADLDRHRR